jgi:hypothetical protein
MRIRDRIAVRGQRRAERRHGSEVEFHGFAGPARWDQVVDGGGAEGVAAGGERMECGRRSKTGVYDGHRRGER